MIIFLANLVKTIMIDKNGERKEILQYMSHGRQYRFQADHCQGRCCEEYQSIF
jgi:hypothetical protein